jgi:hypothetical protein
MARKFGPNMLIKIPGETEELHEERGKNSVISTHELRFKPLACLDKRLDPLHPSFSLGQR